MQMERPQRMGNPWNHAESLMLCSATLTFFPVPFNLSVFLLMHHPIPFSVFQSFWTHLAIFILHMITLRPMFHATFGQYSLLVLSLSFYISTVWVHCMPTMEIFIIYIYIILYYILFKLYLHCIIRIHNFVEVKKATM